MVTIQQLLRAAVKQSASDLHIVAGVPPVLRIDGQVTKVRTEALTPDDCQKICYAVLTDWQKSTFEEKKELDFSFVIENVARFRVNLYYQKGSVSGVFRRISIKVPFIETLNLPSAVERVVNFNNGLVLVTGPTGCGKSTTIASLLDKINRERRAHIVTLEDPIEYIHEHQSSIISQREVGVDTDSYHLALKHVLRQDPDVCMLGELRDLETVESAMTIAETGHLVFATLHTNSATQTINRVISIFPSESKERIRMQLSLVLTAIVSQRLIPAIGGGLVAATEILLMNPNIRNLIREDKVHQIQGMMQVGQGKTGMATLNQSIANLVLRQKVDIKNAFLASADPEDLDRLLKKAGV